MSTFANESTNTSEMSTIDAAARLSVIKSYSPEPPLASGSEPPSGFILKLYQMVNGAPDEVISVRSSIGFLGQCICTLTIYHGVGYLISSDHACM